MINYSGKNHNRTLTPTDPTRWYLQDATHYVANPLSGQDPPYICHSKTHQSLQLGGDEDGSGLGQYRRHGWLEILCRFYIWYNHISSNMQKKTYYYCYIYHTIYIVVPEATLFISFWRMIRQVHDLQILRLWLPIQQDVVAPSLTALWWGLIRNDARYVVEMFVSRSWKKLVMVAGLQNHLPVFVISHWSDVCKIVGSNK